jgi:ABC-type siderophore export system fused ATPase/permease subunit|tara:strand:- start:601 stop:798 length:198 start_codon:yes stop_codon:yes gene_type:complete
MPTTTGDYIMLVFMILAALAVVVGVILMALNNQYNKKYSNHLMQMRVLFQGLALAVLFVVVWLST